MFKLELLPRIELESETLPEGRTYTTPSGKFPSVTTVLGNYYGKAGLEEWKERIGRDKAEAISRNAAENGTALHAVLEKFMLNENYDDAHSIEKMRFVSVKKKLEEIVDTVYGVEFPLFSNKLKTAGKADLLVKLKNGAIAILDLKTTNKYKREEWIESYFTQATTYSIMTNELYDSLNVTKIVIIFSTNDFGCYCFEKDIQDYAGLVNKIFIENRC